MLITVPLVLDAESRLGYPSAFLRERTFVGVLVLGLLLLVLLILALWAPFPPGVDCAVHETFAITTLAVALLDVGPAVGSAVVLVGGAVVERGVASAVSFRPFRAVVGGSGLYVRHVRTGLFKHLRRRIAG